MHDVHVPGFDGPLTLLLQLVQRREFDITTVSLSAISDEYFAALQDVANPDPRVTGAFIETMARLAHLKSRALLPLPEPEEEFDADEFDGEDGGQDLIDRLNEYRRFTSAFEELEQRQEGQLRLFPRLAPIDLEDFGPGLGTTTAGQLQKLMLEVLSRKPAEEEADRRLRVPRQRVSIREHIDRLNDRLRRTRRFVFREALESCRTRAEVILSFLALLELLKSGVCEALQEHPWGEIEIVAAELARHAAREAEPVRESAGVA